MSAEEVCVKPHNMADDMHCGNLVVGEKGNKKRERRGGGELIATQSKGNA